ncbi:trypsin-like serine protease [Flavobacterium sufflavum]|uniref:Trypsin-like serine protease n=1 Tax=Flavobacterium sufflavum TaxID=1921138 RepID=A0A437KTA0_9FLAO|nr:trypsin-like serine protease [Flavobacterium sufflavum]RVT75327.1 trypsin-like serine protease [Flavobacterium sufflavum]
MKLLLLFFSVICYSQNNCDKIFNGCDKPCGPVEKREERIILNEDQNKVSPYSYVIHQTFNRIFGNFSSTSSFIAPDVLITAHHNVIRQGMIKGITLYNPANNNQNMYLKKKEFIIYTYKSKLNPLTDIAIIKFKNPNKIKAYYFGHFQLDKVDNIKTKTSEVHLTGFPCDMTNTKIDKKCTINDLYLDDKMSLIGYNMFTCTGDSGAPLWLIDNDKPTIIGIHHGGNEGYINNCFNISAKMDTDFLKWINQYIAK